MRTKLIVTAVVLALTRSASAGDLNVVGNLNVASNLAPASVTLGGVTRTNWPSGSAGGIGLTNGVVDPSLGSYFAITLTTNVAWNFQGHAAGRSFTLKVAQDSAGGWTNDWGTNVLWAGGVKWPALTTQAERWDLLRFVDDGANWLGIVDGTGYRFPCLTNCNFAVSMGAYAGEPHQQVTVPPAAAFTPESSFTFEFWAQHGGTEQWVLHCGNNSDYDGWAIRISPDYVLFRRQAYGGISGWSLDTTDNGWHHYAITFAAGTFTCFVDGESIGTDTGSFSADSNADFIMGLSYGSAGYVLDEVRISNVARYSTTFTPATSFTTDFDTVAYWRFNEGDGSAVADETSNHDGDLDGSPTATWVEGR